MLTNDLFDLVLVVIDKIKSHLGRIRRGGRIAEAGVNEFDRLVTEGALQGCRRTVLQLEAEG